MAKKTILKGAITKITNKYDEHGGVNNNWEWCRFLFNSQETKVIVKVVKEDPRITGVNIFKEKNLTFMKRLPELYRNY